MIIERIRFGTSSLYRPSAISKLIREDRNVLTEEAVKFDGEKRQAKDKEQEDALKQEVQQQPEPMIVPSESAGTETAPLDIVA